MEIRDRYKRAFDAVIPTFSVDFDGTGRILRKKVTKKLLIGIAAAAVTIAVTSAAFATDLWGIRKTVSRLIDRDRLSYETTEVNPGGNVRELYTDEDGNEYRFDESGDYIGMTYDPENLAETSSLEHKEDPDHPFTDEDAISAAEELGREQFGEAFGRLTFWNIFTDDAGLRTVNYCERLGDGGFVVGIRFYASFFADGTLFGYGMPNYAQLKDFDESMLDGLTLDWFMADIDAKTHNLYGDDFVEWYLAGHSDYVSLCRDESGFYLNATVFTELAYGEMNGIIMDDGGHEYKYYLPIFAEPELKAQLPPAEEEHLVFDHSEENLNGTVNDVYTDEGGNNHVFSESGEKVGYLMNPEDVRSPEGMTEEGLSEDNAVRLARELGLRDFPDDFPGMELTEVSTDEGNLTVTVLFEQRLGANGFVRGKFFYAILNPNGTVFAYGLPNRDELAGFDVSMLKGLNEEVVSERVESFENELHGESLVRYETKSINLKKDADGFYLEVSVYGYVKSDSGLSFGEELFDGGRDLRIDLD